MPRAIHPAMQAGSDRIHVAVGVSEIFAQNLPLDAVFADALFNRAAFGVGVREEFFFRHSPTVITRQRQKFGRKSERRDASGFALMVDLLKALLLQLLDLIKRSVGFSRP